MFSLRSFVNPPVCSADSTRSWWALVVVAALGLAGCSPEPECFSPNLLAEFRAEYESDVKLSDARPIVLALLDQEFGTLDEPKIPSALGDASFAPLIDIDAVKRSAGTVYRDEDRIEFGLFRKHCAVCHGVEGNGLGASASLLDPYPRDFRRGTFKFGTQGQGNPPSHADLARIISEGIPGTAMPAMRNLQEDKYFAEDCETLAHYVQFLSIRGEVERKLWFEIIPELDSSQLETFAKRKSGEAIPSDVRERLDETIVSVANRWMKVVANPVFDTKHELAYSWPEDLVGEKKPAMLTSARRGAELFKGEITACIQCHGEKGDGKGRLVDFDEWTKDWTLRVGVDPRDKTQWKPLKSIGLLKPVPDKPRNLKNGVFRGGNDPSLIYSRLVHGIDGTPMPAVPKAANSPVGLTEDQIWDLVNYCQALAFASEELDQ